MSIVDPIVDPNRTGARGLGDDQRTRTPALLDGYSSNSNSNSNSNINDSNGFPALKFIPDQSVQVNKWEIHTF